MSQLVPARLRSVLAGRKDRGMTTAEYAVGTVAVVLFGGVLAKIFTDDFMQELIRRIIEAIIQAILNILGITL
jgi:hypothetical protein